MIHGEKLVQQVPKFDDRVRFNWGFHDGTHDASRGQATQQNGHFDGVYAAAYRLGVASFDELKIRPETSDDAWRQYQDSGAHSAH